MTGVAAAVVMADGVAWTGVSGMSDPGRSVPIEPDTLFNIGSTGKNFVAALIFRLIEEDKLTLDQSISAWLPKYHNVDGLITVRQLLNHTSGIFDFVKNENSPWQNPRASFDTFSINPQISTKRIGALIYCPQIQPKEPKN